MDRNDSMFYAGMSVAFCECGAVAFAYGEKPAVVDHWPDCPIKKEPPHAEAVCTEIDPERGVITYSGGG